MHACFIEMKWNIHSSLLIVLLVLFLLCFVCQIDQIYGLLYLKIDNFGLNIEPVDLYGVKEMGWPTYLQPFFQYELFITRDG